MARSREAGVQRHRQEIGIPMGHSNEEFHGLGSLKWNLWPQQEILEPVTFAAGHARGVIEFNDSFRREIRRSSTRWRCR
jgi:hypothetical protein